jgi:hypothetical protein
MWTVPDHPAIAEAARTLFAKPDSPWRATLASEFGPEPPVGPGLEASPLLRLAPFRDALVAALADKTPAGSCYRKEGSKDQLHYDLPKRGGGSIGVADRSDVEPLSPGERHPLRACDWLAYRLSKLDGTPAFSLEWPEPRRDEAIAAIGAFLQAHGDRYEAAQTAEYASSFRPLTRLAYPPLGRPATAEDVRADRAIFSLEAEGNEVRTVPLPRIPIGAIWRTRPGASILGIVAPKPNQPRDPSLDDVRTGTIWQVEEVRVGDTWRRYYGYVGPDAIGRVSADALAFLDEERFFGYPRTALDFRLTLDTSASRLSWRGLTPSDRIEAVVTIGNRMGQDREAPQEFLRRGDAGPSLRRGVELSLSYTPTSADDPFDARVPSGPKVQVPPIRQARFDDASPATRHLGPGESFEAFRLDLREWFDLSRPGLYELSVRFDESLAVTSLVGDRIMFGIRTAEADQPPKP